MDEVLSNQFYVDDLLIAEGSSRETIPILREGRRRLSRYHIDLCKINSNNPEILAEFTNTSTLPEFVEFSCDGIVPQSDHGPSENVTSSLGLRWNTKTDSFQIKSKTEVRPYTKRGLLSYLMRSFDPLGFISPAMLKHRLLQRLIIPKKNEDSGELRKLE